VRRLEPVRQPLELLVLTFRLALDESDDSQKSYSQQKHGSRFWYRSTIGCREAVGAVCPVSGENERPSLTFGSLWVNELQEVGLIDYGRIPDSMVSDCLTVHAGFYKLCRMILEVAVLDFKQGLGSPFDSAFKTAAGVISQMHGYRGHDLQRCIEQPPHCSDRLPFFLGLLRWRPPQKRTDHLDDAPVKCVELWQGSNGD
jgi:hypothetical protein